MSSGICQTDTQFNQCLCVCERFSSLQGSLCSGEDNLGPVAPDPAQRRVSACVGADIWLHSCSTKGPNCSRCSQFAVSQPDPGRRQRRKAASCSGKKTVCQQGFASDSRLWGEHKSPVERSLYSFIQRLELSAAISGVHPRFTEWGCVRRELHNRKLKPFQIFVLKVNTCLCSL